MLGASPAEPPLGRAMRLVWAPRARRWLRLVTMVTRIMQKTCAVCLIWHVSARREALGNVAVHPDALMSTQPSFHRCSRPRKKVCPYWPFSLLSACLACESGNVCRGSPGLPGATPRFLFLFGNRVDGNWTIPCLGSCGGSKWSHF